MGNTNFSVQKAAVIGAGTMGAGIAALIADAGIPVVLLDIVPSKLTEEDIAKGIDPQSPIFRNRLAQSGKDRVCDQKRGTLYDPDHASLITVGNLEDDLDNPDSPFLNRTMCAYSVGSVFKLVSAATALEAGITPEYAYYCDGSIEVDGQTFRCFDGTAHGTVTMADAISRSCNGYFVSLMQQVDPAEFLE